MGRGLLSNFDNHFERYRNACTALSSVRNSGAVDQVRLVPLLNLCNDRIVGASKLLHFVGPDRFAIWDFELVPRSSDLRPITSDKLDDQLSHLSGLIRLIPLDATTEQQVATPILDSIGQSVRFERKSLFFL
jgi:hypothetical protein